MASSETKDVLKLTHTNYAEWIETMEAVLRREGHWRKLNVSELDAKVNPKGAREHAEGLDKAAGIIFLSVSPELRGPLKSLRDDAKAMLIKTQELYGTSSAGARFNSLFSLLSITMNTEEDIPTFLSRVQECSRVLKATRPNSYSLSDLDDELVLSALLRGTPYATLTVGVCLGLPWSARTIPDLYICAGSI